MRNPFVLAAMLAATMRHTVMDHNLSLFRSGVRSEPNLYGKTGASYPHHSAGECERRRRQIARGIIHVTQ